MIYNERTNQTFKIDINQNDSIFCTITIVVPQDIINEMYHEAALFQQHTAQTPGFNKGNVPLGYIKENYKEHLTSHIKHFLLEFYLINYLREELYKKKILFSGEPRLVSISLHPDQDAIFILEISTFSPPILTEWRYLPFKKPRRKNYRDLDRQVEQFVQYEKDLEKQHINSVIKPNDWISYSLSLLSTQEKPLLHGLQDDWWLKIGNEETDKDLADLFIGKKIGDTFTTTSKGIQECFGNQLTTHYTFKIEIQNISHHSFFDFEQFKKQFRIKTNKEMLQKMIEVFSYRNDISQRRAIAEGSLKLLLSKHRITPPNHFVLRQKEVILQRVSQSPDYYVYRTQKDFDYRLGQLAERQVKEQLLLEQIIHDEKMTITKPEIEAYLNLLKRPRTKDFFYFDPPVSKLNGKEIPIAHKELKTIFLREKALNFIIYHLTKV